MGHVDMGYVDAARVQFRLEAFGPYPIGAPYIMITEDVALGEGVQIFQPDLVNLYGCTIGDRTKIGTFVEIQKGASVGRDCKISSHSFICEGVDIEDGVFIGHGVMFINDIYPQAVVADGRVQTQDDWKVV